MHNLSLIMRKHQTILNENHSFKKKIKQKGFSGGSVVKNLPANAGVRWLILEGSTYQATTKSVCHHY